LEEKISVYLEIHRKRAKGQARFKGYLSTRDYLVTLRIIMDECHNNKTNLLCWFVYFRKYFDIVPKTNLFYNRLEKIKFHFKLRFIVIRMCENIIGEFRNIEGCSKEINCNIVLETKRNQRKKVITKKQTHAKHVQKSQYLPWKPFSRKTNTQDIYLY
jgi:hypothetical protein